MARPKTCRTAEERLSYGIQHIHLSVPSGHRYLKAFRPQNTRIGANGEVFATAELYGKVYKCKMMARVPAWRIVDEKGRYITVHFPEGQQEYERQVNCKHATSTGEGFLAPPYCWEDDPVAQKMEN